jgi:hypothetical protein
VRILGLILLLLLAADTSLAARVPPGAPSAEAAWTKARDAYRQGDFRTYITTIAPEAHDECLCQMSKLLSAAIGAEALEAEEGLDDLNEILERHGVLNYEAPAHRADSLKVPGLWGRAALGRIQDKVGLYHDVMRYLRKEKVGPELPPLLALRLNGLVVNGGRATARLSGNPRLKPEAREIAFERRGESWFVRLPPLCLNSMPPVDQPYRR